MPCWWQITLLDQKFKATAPNQAWVTDITYIPTDESWLYLAGRKDIFTGEIIGYAMGPRMTKNLVSQSLFKSVAAKRPANGLILDQLILTRYTLQSFKKSYLNKPAGSVSN